MCGGVPSVDCEPVATMDRESTEWTTVSMPKEAHRSIRNEYEEKRKTVYPGEKEPLWAFLLRVSSEADGPDDVDE